MANQELFEPSLLSIIPPFLAIVLAILTKRVFLSLGIGILVGSLFLANFSPIKFFPLLLNKIINLFYESGEWNSDSLLILSFLIILGILTEALKASGGQESFTKLAIQKIKSKRGTLLLTNLFGIFIFIDDYFNALAVGSICRPLTDQQKISRSKLSYIIHSTAGPVCSLAPISSWGATIMAIFAGVIAAHQLTGLNPLIIFVESIPLNFYAINAIILIFLTTFFSFDFPLMQAHQRRVDKNPELLSDDTFAGPAEQKSSFWALLTPIFVLIFGVFFLIFFLGFLNLPQGTSPTLLKLVEHSEVGEALALGGLFSVLISFLFIKPSLKTYLNLGFSGFKSMLPAIKILLFAWTIGSIVKDLRTGVFLSTILTGKLGADFLIPLTFILSGIMAFATGSSWATFGIMIPIAADTTISIDPDLIIYSFGAVIGGAVFGDHSSPISDTAILAASGSKCDHMDHVLSQLPYCLFAAVIAFIGHFLTGFTRNALVSYIISLAIMIIAILIFKRVFKIKNKDETPNIL